MQALLIFPHQLFESNATLATSMDRVLLIEDSLFFVQYRFHKQKLVLHRASMQAHAEYLRSQGNRVDYIESAAFTTLLAVFESLAEYRVNQAHYIDVVDDWLQQRLEDAGAQCAIALIRHRSPMFLTEDGLLDAHFSKSATPRMVAFYRDQRRQKDILVESGAPVGGQWSFDEDNRKRLPKNYSMPPPPHAPLNRFVEEAQRYVSEHFADNPGSVAPFVYPVTFADARVWLGDFLQHRLPEFGDYEDAISQEHEVLLHSVLTPPLNIGLLTPAEVIEGVLAQKGRIPMNSLEGFVRQVIGWREYMRGAYVSRGRRQRTHNFWQHSRPMPNSFWLGTTGIAPIDTTIRKLLRCAYAHHIERLMILANFMLLCEFHPNQVYQWFMEMFIDSYDWVMVPNVYAMALYADGGGITTKPYISGSNYILKMSDFKRGPWCEVWDALYWRFIDAHRAEFAANPRTQFFVKGLDRMSAEKRSQHRDNAERFLQSLAN